MAGMMYSATITYSDYLAAGCENDIEASLLRLLEFDSDCRTTQDEIREYVEALKKIDHLKISGEYETFRDETIKAVRAANEKAERDFEAANPGWRERMEAVDRKLAQSGGEIDRQLRNLFDGLRSPDPDQKKRFIGVYDGMGLATKTYAEVEHMNVLPALERAKKPKGRHQLPTPWTNEIEHMDAMRLMVDRGVNIIDAAHERANEEGRPMANADERARTLAKLYRQRVKLRNK